MLKSRHITLAALLAAAATSASAALSVTNGNFETGGGDNLDDITGWSDNSNGVFWQGSWVSNNPGQTPNGTNVAILGSFESGSIRNTASADVNAGNYLYQSIGTVSGATSLTVSFDFGQPDDDNGGRTLGVSVGLYVNTGAAFASANNTDVRGASGITFIGSQSFTHTSVNLDDQISTVSASFIIDGSYAGQEIFLRFNNYRPAATESWSVVDNIGLNASAIPEPGAFAAVAGLAALAGAVLRRRRQA